MRVKFRPRVMAGLLIVAAASLPFSAVIAQTRGCAACASRLELNQAQWRCLAEQIDLYLGMQYDPVLITTEGCGPAHTRTDQPDISLRSVEGGRSTAPVIIQLSQGQLRCLRDRIPEIEEPSSTQALDLDRVCGPAEIGAGR